MEYIATQDPQENGGTLSRAVSVILPQVNTFSSRQHMANDGVTYYSD